MLPNGRPHAFEITQSKSPSRKPKIGARAAIIVELLYDYSRVIKTYTYMALTEIVCNISQDVLDALYHVFDKDVFFRKLLPRVGGIDPRL